jgi:hypothetical protein
VFLRVLEYYNGILFLTTNRVGTLDEAFKSRIHMSLYYPPLRKQQTRAIWEMNLKRLKRMEEQRRQATGEPPLTIYEKEILAFAIAHYERHSYGRGRWNGRQIRNAFQIASSLARHDMHSAYGNILESDSNTPPINRELRANHFEIVAKATLDFDRYMNETVGKTDAELAFEHGDRADHISRGFQGRKRDEHVSYEHGSAYSYKEGYLSANRDDPGSYGQGSAYPYQARQGSPGNTNRHTQSSCYPQQRPAMEENDQEMGTSPTLAVPHETPPPPRAKVRKPQFNYSSKNYTRSGYAPRQDYPADDSENSEEFE